MRSGFFRICKLIAAWAACLMIMASVCPQNAYAAETAHGISTDLFAYIPFGEERSVNIALTDVGGRTYLFLPANISLKSVVFHYDQNTVSIAFSDGKVLEPDSGVDITSYLSKDTGDGSRILNLTVTRGADTSVYDVYVMQSANIPGVFIESADAAHGREYVETSKSNHGSGHVTMLTQAGGVVYDGELDQIKARGNTTFEADKKAYQIKLDSATDLIQTGKADNASKTWILLANAYDPTLIHNTTAYRMADAFGLNAPDCRSVDLYYDGVYRGNYLLCEKVQIASGRVDITNLEKSNDKANDGRDPDKAATAMGANRYGDIFRYVTGMNNPEDYSGGYLLELDNAYYNGERCYFLTSTGVAFTVKSPENCSKEEMIYISEYVEDIVQASQNGGVMPDGESSVWDYIDLKALSRYFVLQETVANSDSFASSTYFYLDKDGKLTAGPVWDFDDSFGIREDHSSTDGFIAGGFIEPFMNLPEFRREVRAFVSSSAYTRAAGGKTDTYVSEIASSQKMDRILWAGHDVRYTEQATYDEDISYMKTFAAGRLKWLKGVFATW